jgi:hypothetical protein
MDSRTQILLDVESIYNNYPPLDHLPSILILPVHCSTHLMQTCTIRIGPRHMNSNTMALYYTGNNFTPTTISLVLEPTCQTHNIIWINSFLQCFQSRDVPAIHILQRSTINSIVRVYRTPAEILSISDGSTTQLRDALSRGFMKVCVKNAACPRKINV